MNISFDQSIFANDIERARDSTPPDKPIEVLIREHGLRYVVEAPTGMEIDEVHGFVRETLYPEVVVESMFEDIGDNPTPDDLRCFYLVIYSGVGINDLTQSPYEAAYALLELTPLISVEPDLPYTQFLGVHGTSSPPAGAKVADKAWALRNIRADKAWRIPSPNGKQNGQGISIAHLDTGWTVHDDLDWKNFDMTIAKDYIDPKGDAGDPLNYYASPGHGTRTGSVIMSDGDITLTIPPGTTGPGEITGVAREITYIPIRCIKSVVVIFNSYVAKAIRYATAKQCDVISMSLGGRGMKALHRSIQDAVKNDILVVSAAGNDVRTVVWPARYLETIAVAANNENDMPWAGSSRGKSVDITAPGESVWKADPDPTGTATSCGDGTSYATAHLAGVASLWLAFHNKKDLLNHASSMGISLQELFRASVKSTARKPKAWDTRKYGAGIVDAEKLLRSKVTIKSLKRYTSSSLRYSSKLESFYKLLSLINKDEDIVNEFVLRLIFSESDLSYDEVSDFFGHELASIFLDHPEIQNFVESVEFHDEDKLNRIRFKIASYSSQTLSKNIRIAESED